MEKSTQRDIATSLTTLVFLTVGISGVMMYFHVLDKYVKSMHEILGLAFVVAVVLHVLVHIKSMKQYFTKKIFLGIAAVTIAVVIGFIASVESGGANPKGTLISKVLNNPLEQTLVLFGDVDEAKMKLESAGIKLNGEKSISQIAKANKTSPFRIVDILSK